MSDAVLSGVYANMLQVGHTPEEFVMDFMNIFPPTGTVTARIIISPSHMKRIVAALQENIKKYEEQFGLIKTADAQPMPTITSSSNHKFGFDTEKAK